MVEREIERSTFEQKRLGYEIENLSNEAQAMRGQLSMSRRKVRAAEDRMAEAESRLETLTAQESALRPVVDRAERVTVEVRGRDAAHRPARAPRLLVAPDDVLSSMRAAILLRRGGAVNCAKGPRTREGSEKSRRSRRERLRRAPALPRERDQIAAERTRLAELIDSRQKQIGLNRNQLETEKQEGRDAFARGRVSQRDLIARSENEIVGSPQAVEFARRAPPPARGQSR